MKTLGANILGGTAHRLPSDMQKALAADVEAQEKWEDISPLARNEWICWTISVKQQKTRDNHIARLVTELKAGKRRPCCWMGCTHRTDKAMSPTQEWISKRRTRVV